MYGVANSGVLKMGTMLDLTKNRYSSQWRADNSLFAEKMGTYKGYQLSVKFDGDDSDMANFLRKTGIDKTGKKPSWIAYASKVDRGDFQQATGKTKEDAIRNVKKVIDDLEKSFKQFEKSIELSKPKIKPDAGYEWRYGDHGWVQLKKR